MNCKFCKGDCVFRGMDKAEGCDRRIPMSLADYIRNMTDLELAQFLTAIISERDKVMSEKLTEQGVQHRLIEIPALSVMHHLKFLQRPAEEVVETEE